MFMSSARYSGKYAVPLADLRNALLLLILSCLLAGCVLGALNYMKPAQLESMIVEESPERIFPEDSPFKNAIYLLGVSGGQGTYPITGQSVDNPEFEGALHNSLQAHGLSANNKEISIYYLEAILEDFANTYIPARYMAGWGPYDDMVTSTIRYKLTEKGRGDPFMEKSITATYEVKVEEELNRYFRYRLALEGSVRENIKAFLRELAFLKER